MGNVTAYTNQSYVISIAFDEEEYENEKNTHKTDVKNEGTAQLKPKLKSQKSIMANLQGHEIEVDRSNLKWSK